MKLDIKDKIKNYYLIKIIGGVLFLLIGIYFIVMMFSSSFFLGKVNYNQLIKQEGTVNQIVHDNNNAYYYISLNNENGTLVLDARIVKDQGMLMQYEFNEDIVYFIKQADQDAFNQSEMVYCYSLSINQREVYSFETYISSFNDYQNEIFLNGIKALSSIFLSALLLDNSKKKIDIKDGEQDDMSPLRE